VMIIFTNASRKCHVRAFLDNGGKDKKDMGGKNDFTHVQRTRDYSTGFNYFVYKKETAGCINPMRTIK